MGVRGIMGRMWVLLLLAPLCLAGPAKDPNAKCLECHDQAGYKGSVHEMMGCTGCHVQHESYPHPANVPKPKCETCHADEVKTFATSVHAERAKTGTADTPTCGNCHGNDALAKKHGLPNVYPLYIDSIHGFALSKEGLLVAANCQSCHGSHHILSHADPQSPTYKTNIPKTCGQCHAGITAN